MKIKLLPTVCLLCLCTTAIASNLQLWQQNASTVGDFAAGAAASANDPSTAFYNPAGLVRAKHQVVSFSEMGPFTDLLYRGNSRFNPQPFPMNDSGTVQGGDSPDIPTLLYEAPISPKWGFGFSVTSPFYSEQDFDKASFTRYAVEKNSLSTIAIGPSMAFRPIHSLSIGVGVEGERLEWEYKHADIGNAPLSEGTAKTDISGWAPGFNAGILWMITKQLRVGASYHSRVVHHLSGKSRFAGQIVNHSRATADIILPAFSILSAYYQISTKWSVMASANYTQWKDSNNWTLKNMAGPLAPTNFGLQNQMQNSWRFGLGVHYHPTDKWVVRGGMGYDQAAVKSNTQNILLSDADQYVVGMGVGYHVSDTMFVEFGYDHSFMPNSHIQHTQTNGMRQLTNTGDLIQSADLMGIQLNWQMT